MEENSDSKSSSLTDSSFSITESSQSNKNDKVGERISVTKVAGALALDSKSNN